jgi:hypothetical protein
MIYGTLNPTGGSIQTHGRIAALLELGSGFNREFKGRENVYMNSAVLGLSHDKIDAQFNDIAAFAGTGNFFKISFGFRMDLLPGIYFVGDGIGSSQEPSCLHRILDAIMFRVVPLKQAISFGYADMSTEEPNIALFSTFASSKIGDSQVMF